MERTNAREDEWEINGRNRFEWCWGFACDKERRCCLWSFCHWVLDCGCVSKSSTIYSIPLLLKTFTSAQHLVSFEIICVQYCQNDILIISIVLHDFELIFSTILSWLQNAVDFFLHSAFYVIWMTWQFIAFWYCLLFLCDFNHPVSPVFLFLSLVLAFFRLFFHLHLTLFCSFSPIFGLFLAFDLFLTFNLFFTFGLFLAFNLVLMPPHSCSVYAQVDSSIFILNICFCESFHFLHKQK